MVIVTRQAFLTLGKFQPVADGGRKGAESVPCRKPRQPLAIRSSREKFLAAYSRSAFYEGRINFGF
jgi:hypothetical protein